MVDLRPFPISLACRHLTLPGSLLKKRQVRAEGSLANGNLGVSSSNKGKEKVLVREGREEMKEFGRAVV